MVRFCDLCLESIPDREIETGQSLEMKGRWVCTKCRRRLVPPLPSARIAAFLALLTLVGILGAGWYIYQLEGASRQQQVNLEALDSWLHGRLETQEKLLAERARELEGKIKAMEAEVAKVGRHSRHATGTLGASLRSLQKSQEERFQTTEAGFNRLTAGLARLTQSSGQGGEGIAKVKGLVEDLGRRIDTLKGGGNPAPKAPAGGDPTPTPPAAVPPGLARLAERLRHTEPDERWKAIEALEKLGTPEAVKLVARALSDTDLWVRRLAAEVLGRMGGEGGVGELIKALADSEFMVRGAAIASLRKLTTKNFDYNPHDSAAKRRSAIQRWEAWWSTRQAGAR